MHRHIVFNNTWHLSSPHHQTAQTALPLSPPAQTASVRWSQAFQTMGPCENGPVAASYCGASTPRRALNASKPSTRGRNLHGSGGGKRGFQDVSGGESCRCFFSCSIGGSVRVHGEGSHVWHESLEKEHSVGDGSLFSWHFGT